MQNTKMIMLCVSWHCAPKNVWKLPVATHANVIYGLSDEHSIEDGFMIRSLKFSFQCISK
jgi:hypothetical protein